MRSCFSLDVVVRLSAQTHWTTRHRTRLCLFAGGHSGKWRKSQICGGKKRCSWLADKVNLSLILKPCQRSFCFWAFFLPVYSESCLVSHLITSWPQFPVWRWHYLRIPSSYKAGVIIPVSASSSTAAPAATGIRFQKACGLLKAEKQQLQFSSVTPSLPPPSHRKDSQSYCKAAL